MFRRLNTLVTKASLRVVSVKNTERAWATGQRLVTSVGQG